MTLCELIALARIRLDDCVQPYLWSDAALIEFANSSVTEACMRSRILQTKITLPVATGISEYEIPYVILLPKLGLFIDKAGETVTAGSFIPGLWYSIDTPGTTAFTSIGAANNLTGTLFQATGVGTGTGTAILGKSNPLFNMGEDEFVREHPYTCESPSRPLVFKRSERANHIQVNPVPSLDGYLVLNVYRIPTQGEAMVSHQDEPVIPVEFHRDLVYWMLAEAYQVNDTDKANEGRSAANEAKFEARFGRKITARGEQMGRKGVVGRSMYGVEFGGSPV